jgi:hypothetical protein
MNNPPAQQIARTHPNSSKTHCAWHLLLFVVLLIRNTIITIDVFNSKLLVVSNYETTSCPITSLKKRSCKSNNSS